MAQIPHRPDAHLSDYPQLIPANRFNWLVLLVLAFAGVTVVGLFIAEGIVVAFGVMGLVATAISMGWNRIALEDIFYDMEVSHQRVEVGETVPITVSLVNRKPVPLVWVKVEDEFPNAVKVVGGDVVQNSNTKIQSLRHLTSMGWYERIRWDYEVKCTKRGLYRMGPATLESGDPFGFVRTQKIQHHRSHIMVLPRIVPLADLGLPAVRPLGEVRGGDRIYEDVTRPAGLRDYQKGDSLTRIDWKATARNQKLLVRTFDPSSTVNVVIAVAVDTTEPFWRLDVPEALERVITVAAVGGEPRRGARLHVRSVRQRHGRPGPAVDEGASESGPGAARGGDVCARDDAAHGVRPDVTSPGRARAPVPPGDDDRSLHGADNRRDGRDAGQPRPRRLEDSRHVRGRRGPARAAAARQGPFAQVAPDHDGVGGGVRRPSVNAVQTRLVLWALVIGESAWVFAVLGVLGLWMGQDSGPLSWPTIVVLMLVSLYVGRLGPSERMGQGTETLVRMLIGFLFVYVAVAVELSENLPFVDPLWVFKAFTASEPDQFWFKFLAGGLAGAGLWVRGGKLGVVAYPTDELAVSFRIGIVALIIATLVDLINEVDLNTFLMVFIFFGASLAGLAMGHLQPRSKSVRSNIWPRIVFAMVAFVVVIGLAFTVVPAGVLDRGHVAGEAGADAGRSHLRLGDTASRGVRDRRGSRRPDMALQPPVRRRDPAAHSSTGIAACDDDPVGP